MSLRGFKLQNAKKVLVGLKQRESNRFRDRDSRLPGCPEGIRGVRFHCPSRPQNRKHRESGSP